MTQDELKALIEDLRLNHEYCPKEVILQAADELERLAQPEQEPVIDQSAAKRIATVLGWTPPRTWVGLTDEERNTITRHHAYVDSIIKATEAKLKEKNT